MPEINEPTAPGFSHLPSQPPSSRGWLKILLVLGVLGGIGLAGLLLLVLLAAAAVGAAGGIPLPGTSDIEQELKPRVIFPGTGEAAGNIAVISVNGPIMGDGSAVEGTGAVYNLTRQLRRAAADDSVKAVLLQIDSPGGGLTASDLIHRELLALREKGKKLVVWVGDLAASGGYYLAAPADHIVLSPTGMVGSIGVIMMRFQVEELMAKLGVKPEPLKSTAMKDLGSPFRELTTEEKAFFAQLLEHFHEHFVSVVAAGRRLDPAEVRKLADGRIYTAPQAQANHLVDEIGYFDAALAKARELAGAADAGVIIYERQFRFEDLFRSRDGLGLATLRSQLQDLLASQSGPRAMALWNAAQ